MNKIWAGLIIVSFLFAIGSDIRDEWFNIHKNGNPIEVMVVNENAISFEQNIVSAKLVGEKGIQELVLSYSDSWPTKFVENAELRGKARETLRLTVVSQKGDQISALLPQVHVVKLRAITTAAFDMAETAVKIAIGLIGVMALWLGLLKIAEESNLVRRLVKFVHPLIGKLFPDIPKDHPALANISLNLTANILGLGNAATPLGIKAMEELQKLNKNSDTASDAMCMFLAINTSSVQLLPPVTLVALMGVGVSELMVSITLATIISTVVGISGALYFRRKSRKMEANYA